LTNTAAPFVATGIGDQREHPERRRLHDDADNFQQHRRQRLQPPRERPPRLARHHRADAQQDRDKDQRQHVALAERLDDVERHDADQLLVRRHGFGEHVRRRRPQRRSGSGLHEGRHRHSHGHGDRRGACEQPDRPPAETPQPLRIGQRGDAAGDRHQHDGRHQHADRAHEQVAHELHVRRPRRPDQRK
jgi:hypothetical protein